MRLAVLVLALILAVVSPALGAEKVERLAVVDQAIEYHGGELFQQSEIRLRMCSKSGCSELRARVDGGRFDLEAAAAVSDGHRRVRITNDSVARWENGARRVVESELEQRFRDWVMSRIYFTFLPFRLNDPSVFKQDLGAEEWNGRLLHKVKVTFTPGSSTHAQDEYLYWFDPQTGRLEQFAYSYATGGGGLRFRRTFNHRRVGGIGFFDQENLGVNGPDLSVDLITPDYVAGTMTPVSTITLHDITVEVLTRGEPSP